MRIETPGEEREEGIKVVVARSPTVDSEAREEREAQESLVSDREPWWDSVDEEDAPSEMEEEDEVGGG